jgi:(p)ppGpp synthase/HD superfamily hydrolase
VNSSKAMPNRDLQPLLAALAFAAEKHRGQHRKDAAATPYINHPITVAETLATIGGIVDTLTLQAALLHDTLEDTATTPEELDHLFGTAVRRIVEELTDDKSLPYLERKRLQIAHAPSLSLPAKQIKIADKISNTSDISESDPATWDRQRKLDYLSHAQQVVAGCRGFNPQLEHHFDAILLQKRQLLSAK